LGSTTTANPMASPAATTSYSLQLTDAENCTSTGSVTLTLVTPVAAFGALPNLLVVGFTDQSTAATTWAWDFGDGGSSTLQNPTHTYAAAGSYAVCLTINGATNCEAIFCDSVNVVSVGIGNALAGASVHVYPNPATGNQINFEIQGAGMSDAIQIELFDQQGKLVHQYQGAASQLIHTLNRKELSAGAYQYRVRSGDGLLGTGKVVLR
jgi:PKD domain/Secretion system C-terminal sorting domain